MTKNNSDKEKKPEISGKNGKNENERKKRLNTFAYYLGWVAFFSALGSAFVKLVEKWEPPAKDDYYK